MTSSSHLKSQCKNQSASMIPLTNLFFLVGMGVDTAENQAKI